MTELAWGKKVTSAFKEQVIQISTALNVDANSLMTVFAFATGRTFSPSSRNPLSGTVGLLQFTPSMATALGTSIPELANMTAEAQLGYVMKYLQNFKNRINSLDDLYMAILCPSALGQAESYVLFRKGSAAYDANKVLDTNLDGVVTKIEACHQCRALLQVGLREYRG